MREKGSYQEKQLILGAASRAVWKGHHSDLRIRRAGRVRTGRSIDTVARGERKRIGIVATDARLNGGTVMNGMSFQQVQKHPLVDELEKQYEVETIDFKLRDHSWPISRDRSRTTFIVGT